VTIREEDLYAPVIDLFGDTYSVACDVQLGPKRIDLILASKNMDKIIAIEVKVSKWKQALRQALNYQLAADESYVAILKKHSTAIRSDVFNQLGIGLITIDSEGRASIEIPAKLSSRRQSNYSTLLRAYVAEKQSPANSNFSSVPATQSFKNYLWYIANEREYYVQYSDCYDGFLVNAHVLEHFSSAFSALSLSLKKPFFVIPDTHFFQMAPLAIFYDMKGLVKSSWEKIADYYGPLIRLILSQSRNLQVDDFISKSGAFQQSLYDLVQRVISFQKSKVSSAAQGLARFFDSPPAYTPTHLVAPYFFFASTEDHWYRISVEMAKYAIKHKETHELYVVLCTSKSVLMSDAAVSTIIKDFSGLEFAGFLVWIQDFNETDEPVPLLWNLRQFISNLKQSGRKVINLYGAFFSSLMCYYGLDGMGFGICYKEFSDPEDFPEGGPPGGPLPKYYLPEIKTKLGKIEAAITIAEIPLLACSCQICHEQMKYMLDAATPDRISKDLMKKHFLMCKRDERNHVCKSTLPSVLANLSATYRKYQKKAHLVPTEHLRRWMDVCKQPQ
jgi:hypothetical protein